MIVHDVSCRLQHLSRAENAADQLYASSCSTRLGSLIHSVLSSLLKVGERELQGKENGEVVE